ncbi:MAG: hypothetical protein MUP69_10195 [Candidatus Atribacteria bacterium]|nr:hypothetical protein [Candidatus Atribacteria bacterium]
MAEEVKETVLEEPKEKLYSEKEWKGLLGDKQNETRARQEAQAKVAQYELRLAELQSKLEQKASTVEEGDPEDVATIAVLNKKIANLESKLTGMYTKNETDKTTTEKNKLIEKSFEAASRKYTEEKAGKGLTFDEVNEGTKRMIEKNKIYRELILEDENPGEKAYEVGLLDPIIAKRKETYKKTLPPEGVTSKEGLTGTTVPGGFYTQEYVKKMSKIPGWIKEHFAEIKESQKKWNK